MTDKTARNWNQGRLQLRIVLAFVGVTLLVGVDVYGQKNNTEQKPRSQSTEIDWDARYEETLKENRAIRRKIQDGDATKDDIIAWLNFHKTRRANNPAGTHANAGPKCDPLHDWNTAPPAQAWAAEDNAIDAFRRAI